jgi:hypothetical protein
MTSRPVTRIALVMDLPPACAKGNFYRGLTRNLSGIKHFPLIFDSH